MKHKTKDKLLTATLAVLIGAGALAVLWGSYVLVEHGRGAPRAGFERIDINGRHFGAPYSESEKYKWQIEHAREAWRKFKEQERYLDAAKQREGASFRYYNHPSPTPKI